MARTNSSETVTENIFRTFYGADCFIEKSAIPAECGFMSKKGTSYKGYPDFFREEEDYTIIVEAKATKHSAAISEVKYYALNNNVRKDIVCIAVSGQTQTDLKVTYFLRVLDSKDLIQLSPQDALLTLPAIQKAVKAATYKEKISAENLVSTLKKLNKTFNDGNKVRDTERSLFFSGLMIALTDNNFRQTYKNIQAPKVKEVKTSVILEAHNLNEAILTAIANQIDEKVNNLSKEYNWRDKFSFIKNIDYSLKEYKQIIGLIEKNIFAPFQNEEKQDILGRAYKIFLSRAGKVDNKNIIITPDHIKGLMVKLSRLVVDDVVLDTCTGTGGFLMEAMETLVKLADGNTDKIKDIKDNQLIGFEIDSVLFALACSNMFLHGDGRTKLIFRSSLLDGKSGSIINSSDDDILKQIQKWKPTKVIINPPYENGLAIKFTKQALEYLEPNGRLIIIMPTPTLKKNQSGLTEAILKNARLDFVIKMPTGLFTEQGRTVNTSIFGFTKSCHRKDDVVLFYNLEDDGLVSVQHKGRIDKNKRWHGIEKAVIDAIIHSNTVPGLCDKRKLYKDVIDKDGKKVSVLNCYGWRETNSVNSVMVKVSDLFTPVKGTISSEEGDDGNENESYDFITASEEWKKHSTFEFDKEAIVIAVAASGSLGRTHYVNGKFSASNLCYVLTPKKGSKYRVCLEFYNWYFAAIRKQLVSDLADGTSKLTINITDLKEYYIEYIDYDEQIKFVNDNIKKLTAIKAQYLQQTEDTKRNLQAMLSK